MTRPRRAAIPQYPQFFATPFLVQNRVMLLSWNASFRRIRAPRLFPITFNNLPPRLWLWRMVTLGLWVVFLCRVLLNAAREFAFLAKRRKLRLPSIVL